MTTPTFFGAGHAIYHFHISEADFNRSLYYNILMQPSMAWSDHFFLCGEYVNNHLSKYASGESWIESGIRDGIIIPYFRFEFMNLKDAENYFKGQESATLTSHFTDTAKRLDNSGAAQYRRLWPDWMVGELFEEQTIRLLQKPIPPIIDNLTNTQYSMLPDFWEYSRSWRTDHLRMAAERTKERKAHGLRINELVEISFEEVLREPTPSGNQSISNLLSAAKKKVSPTELNYLEIFYHMVCDIYGANLASAFESCSNSPVWDAYIASMEPESYFDESKKGAPEEEHLIKDITLPTLRKLQNINGKEMLSLRGHGRAYRDQLEKWQETPSQENGEALLEYLDEYSRKIIENTDNFSVIQVQVKIDEISPLVSIASAAVGAGITTSAGGAGVSPIAGAVAGAAAGEFLKIGAKSLIDIAEGMSGKERLALTFSSKSPQTVRINTDYTQPVLDE